GFPRESGAAADMGAFELSSAQTGLIHQYTFGGSGVTDSVGSVNGVLVNGATVGGGLLFLGGSAYAQLDSDVVPTGLAPFSILFDAQELNFPSPPKHGDADMIFQSLSGRPGFSIVHTT